MGHPQQSLSCGTQELLNEVNFLRGVYFDYKLWCIRCVNCGEILSPENINTDCYGMPQLSQAIGNGTVTHCCVILILSWFFCVRIVRLVGNIHRVASITLCLLMAWYLKIRTHLQQLQQFNHFTVMLIQMCLTVWQLVVPRSNDKVWWVQTNSEIWFSKRYAGATQIAERLNWPTQGSGTVLSDHPSGIIRY